MSYYFNKVYDGKRKKQDNKTRIRDFENYLNPFFFFYFKKKKFSLLLFENMKLLSYCLIFHILNVVLIY